MRTIVVCVALLLVTPPCAIVVLLASLFRARDGENSIYQRVAHFWAGAICSAAGVKIRVSGQEFEPPPGESGVVFCSNHVGWFDVLSLAVVVRHYTFIAKRELERIPIFGRAARAVGIVFIDRQQRKAAFSSYEEAAAEIRKGKSVIVCPEGTRGYDYTLRPFKKGPFVLAISAGVPIVPTVVYGAREILRKNSISVRGGPVMVHFLPPVETAGFSYDQREELMQIVWNRMADFLRQEYGTVTSVPN